VRRGATRCCAPVWRRGLARHAKFAESQASLEKAPKIVLGLKGSSRGAWVYSLHAGSQFAIACCATIRSNRAMSGVGHASPWMIAGVFVCLAAIGGGIQAMRFCSERFMLLRRAKSATPYLYGIGGMLAMLLVTLAAIGLVILLLGLKPPR